MSCCLKKIVTIRNGAFAFQLFSNPELKFDRFDSEHIIIRKRIKGLWKPYPLLYQADPFLFVKDSELYLFYELQHWNKPACIAMVKSFDLINWTKPKVVLREPFHLSFPFVFKDGENIYMIPESQECDSIRLYKANEDLTSFTFVRTLIKQDRPTSMLYNYNDSHVFLKEGIYYLFTSVYCNNVYSQELYISNSLLYGSFVRHPMSPICVSNKYGRNGGSLIDLDGQLLRVTQNCDMVYGGNVSLMHITCLTDRIYKESVFYDNIYSNNELFPDGGHHLNVVKFGNTYLYSTDYREVRWTWFYFYVVFLTKVRSFFKLFG